MIYAMDQLILDISIPSVDELLVSVLPQNDAFRYASGVALYKGRDQPLTNEWTDVVFEGAAGGGFGYSILTPEQSRIAAIAVHFFQGQLGVLFHPMKLRDPEKYTNVSHTDLQEQVWRRHRISLEVGGSIQGSPD
jgi:hypothetical protein